MLHLNRWYTVVILPALLVLETHPAEGQPAHAAGRAPEQQRVTARRFPTLDAEFAHMATVVPGGFGGWFYDERGRPNVWLMDPTKRSSSNRAPTRTAKP
jgi:hypothetical protein